MYMDISLWMCVCINCPELAVIHRRYTIKGSLPFFHPPLCFMETNSVLDGNLECVVFLFLILGAKLHSFGKIMFLFFIWTFLLFFLQSQALFLYGSRVKIFKQWTEFSFDFCAEGGVYKSSCKVFIPDAIVFVGWRKTIMTANKFESISLGKDVGM